MNEIKKQVSGLSAGCLLSAAITFLLCFYAPFELFLSNQEEFWFDAATIALPSVLLFLLMSVIGCLVFLLCRLLGQRVYDGLLALGTAALLCFYVQGNFLVSGLPPLDGADIDWSAASPERIKSIVAILASLLVAVLLLCLLKRKRFRRVVGIGAGCLLLLFAVTIATLFLGTGVKDKRGDLTSYDAGEFTLSDTDTNTVVLVLDAVDERAFREVLSSHPEYEHLFDDFTLFDNALASYPYSMMSVPMILSGQWYENEQDFSAYVSGAIDNSPLIRHLEKKHYRIGIYDQGDLSLDAETHADRFENQIALRDEASSTGQVWRLLLKMAGLKYAPWDQKRVCYDLVEFSEKIRMAPKEELTPFSWSNRTFYDRVRSAENPFTAVGEPCFRFIHLEGAHVPYKYDPDVNIISSGGSYRKNIEACISLCNAYLASLKKNGFYDNTAVVIMADHGYDGADDRQKIAERMHPMLLVKGIGESHEMRVSNAPVAYEDLAGAFIALSDGAMSDSAFPVKENETRERRMLLYYYLHEDTLYEYTTSGLPYEVDRMTATGNTYLSGKAN